MEKFAFDSPGLSEDERTRVWFAIRRHPNDLDLYISDRDFFGFVHTGELEECDHENLYNYLHGNGEWDEELDELFSKS